MLGQDSLHRCISQGKQKLIAHQRRSIHPCPLPPLNRDSRLQDEVEKGRMSEEKALEKLLTAVPDGPHGRLIRRSLLETKSFSQELDALVYAAEAMADAMGQIAPFDRAY